VTRFCRLCRTLCHLSGLLSLYGCKHQKGHGHGCRADSSFKWVWNIPDIDVCHYHLCVSKIFSPRDVYARHVLMFHVLLLICCYMFACLYQYRVCRQLAVPVMSCRYCALRRPVAACPSTLLGYIVHVVGQASLKGQLAFTANCSTAWHAVAGDVLLLSGLQQPDPPDRTGV
jgi:hypothetical protein